MRLRYAGTCRVCGAELPASAEAIYERTTTTVRCSAHADPELPSPLATEAEPGPAGSPVDAIEAGTPGASARREFERRSARHEERIRRAHPKLGGLIQTLTDDPQSMRAWDVGAVGEERLGNRLNELATDSLRILHDRRIPGSRANIDHLAVTPTGVYVIDAKKYRGRPHLKVEGGLLRPRVEKLLVGTRNCSPVVDGVVKQVAIVRDELDESVPVHGVLCFVEADWPLIGGSFTTRGVEALWPKKLYPKLRSHGPLEIETIATLHRTLAVALKPA
jgi:nuclease-like protein